MERVSCPLCAVKHLGQARALWLETGKGYPENRWYGLGHMAEAEDELGPMFPELVEAIREARKQWEANKKFEVPFGVLMMRVVREADLE